MTGDTILGMEDGEVDDVGCCSVETPIGVSLLLKTFFLVTLPEERFSILLQSPVISLRWWFDSHLSPRIFLHKFGAELSFSSCCIRFKYNMCWKTSDKLGVG